MSVQVTITLTDTEAEYAGGLVEDGFFPDVAAVLRRGLHRLQDDTPTPPTPPKGREALRALLEERLRGPFVSNEEGHRRVQAMMARVRAEYGIPD